MRDRRNYHRPHKRSVFVSAPGLWIAALAVGAAGGMTASDLLSSLTTASPSCNIKGNISTETGERIFHVPGQKYYGQTQIRPQFGERWFCSEGEARAAGWRKSKV
ncbi:succinoglycan biosynthesis protein exoi [Ensifer sp. LCM 4579]|uniref:sunset domain-containing protein n=1 Tax=Ensifer sp. LCM 4579 TaxID=1848292 RepID=UPI0008D966B5|nr:succinoglycan biosynthesis protein exoi [Ensifer sp. LCM 4579]OHV80357.1 succinoglycan biosynthesis protein exoi [Ensifer sp. LCM 4579]